MSSQRRTRESKNSADDVTNKNELESASTTVDSTGKEKKTHRISKFLAKRSIEILLTLILLISLSDQINFHTNDEKDVAKNEDRNNQLTKDIATSSTSSSELRHLNDEDEDGNKERDFLSIGLKHGTDKVEGSANLESCLDTGEPCVRPGCKRLKCRPWGA